MARRNTKHEIGDRAVKIVLNVVPDNWIEQEQSKDYGVDLKFEVFRNERTTGQEFGVQVRGTNSLKLISSCGKQFVTCRLEVENLADHVDKRRYPIYLFRVDNQRQVVYWSFLQYDALKVLNQKWRNQKFVTIRIPVEQTLNNPESFEAVLRDHINFISDLYPSSIAASLNAEKDRVEKLDGRFEVDISATLGQTQYCLTPKEGNVEPLVFRFKGEDAVEKAKTLLEVGGKIDLSESEAEVEGLPEGWRTDYELAAIGFDNSTPAMMRFSTKDPAARGALFLDLHGVVSGGIKRVKFSCELAGGPIRAELPIDAEHTTAPIDLTFDYESWVGLDIKRLPNLDVIAPFFDAFTEHGSLDDQRKVELEVFVSGNRVLPASGDAALTHQLASFAPVILGLRDARYVANELHIDVTVPSKISSQDLHDVSVVYRLLTDGQFECPAPNASVSHLMDASQFEASKGYWMTCRELTTHQGGALPFLTATADPGIRHMKLSSMKLDRHSVVKTEESLVQVTFVATEDCILTLRKCSQEEAASLLSRFPRHT